MSTKVFVGNLAFRTTDQALVEAFGKHGEVKSGVIITRGRRSLGYGFVEFATSEQAAASVDKMNKAESLVAKSRSNSRKTLQKDLKKVLQDVEDTLVTTAMIPQTAALLPTATTTLVQPHQIQIQTQAPPMLQTKDHTRPTPETPTKGTIPTTTDATATNVLVKVSETPVVIITPLPQLLLPPLLNSKRNRNVLRESKKRRFLQKPLFL